MYMALVLSYSLCYGQLWPPKQRQDKKNLFVAEATKSMSQPGHCYKSKELKTIFSGMLINGVSKVSIIMFTAIDKYGS